MLANCLSTLESVRSTIYELCICVCMLGKVRGANKREKMSYTQAPVLTQPNANVKCTDQKQPYILNNQYYT